MDQRLLIYNAAFITDCDFSNIVDFKNAVDKLFCSTDVNSNNQLKNTLNNKIKELLEATKENIGQREALNILLARELERIKNNLENKNRIILNPNEEIKKCVAESINILNSELLSGEPLKDIDVFMVNRFPEPFENATFAVMTFDEADTKKYGIRKDIYFRQDLIAPFRSALLSAHELVHQAIARKDADVLARGLEDGICDFIGTLYLASKTSIFTFDDCSNFLYNTRLGAWTVPSWIRYRINLRQACMIYLKYGLVGLAEIINKGRRYVTRIEEKLLRGERIELPKGEWVGELTTFALRFINFDTTLEVTPLARYIAEIY